MYRSFIRWFPCVALVVLFALSFSVGVRAQSSETPTPISSQTKQATPLPKDDDSIWFVLNPEGKANGDFFNVEVEAGKSIDLTAEIGNGSLIPVKALIYVADAHSDINGGFVMNKVDAQPTGPTTWIDLPTETYGFKPQEGIKRTFAVTVPEGTPPGQYIAGLAVETAESLAVEGDAPIRQSLRLATAIFITVPGPIEPAFTVSDLAVVLNPQSMDVTGVITNTGNVRVRPKGTVTLTNAEGVETLVTPIEMGSVYAHDSTSFVVTLSAPIPEGTYQADVHLTDPDTKATASLEHVSIEVAPAEAPSPLTITQVSVTPMPSSDQVVFAQVAVTLTNTGSTVTGGEVTVQVLRDGEHVDDHVLASSLTLPNGETVVDQPYIPATGTWEPGTYTFQVTLATTDPTSGATSTVGTFTSDQTIVIP